MIVLASSSPRRQELLQRWGVRFKVCSPRIKEYSRYRRPHLLVQDIARQKLLAVFRRCPEKIILAADTVVVLPNRAKFAIIGKPKNIADARKILRRLSGTVHRVYSGLAVISPGGKIYTDYAVSRVKIKKISPQILNLIIHKHLDKAGAYAVQERDDMLVEKIWGDYYNVVGLPCYKTRKILARVGIKLSHKFR